MNHMHVLRRREERVEENHRSFLVVPCSRYTMFRRISLAEDTSLLVLLLLHGAPCVQISVACLELAKIIGLREIPDLYFPKSGSVSAQLDDILAL